MPGLSIGARLIAAREHSKLTLENIAENTKMPLKKLEALENDEVKSEDITAFDKAYLKKYCQFVGVIYDDLFSDLKIKAIKIDIIDKNENKFVKTRKFTRKTNTSINLKFIFYVAGAAVLTFAFSTLLTFNKTDEPTGGNQLILDSAYNQNI